MIKIIDDNGIYRHEYHNEKDMWGRKIYRAYCLDKFDGYRYKRTKSEINKLKKEFGKYVGIREWVDVPMDSIGEGII